MSNSAEKTNSDRTLDLLNVHHDAFKKTVEWARESKHPVPVDTRAWSQILVSVLTGIKGLGRKKGADLEDGSDVKAAITWEAIDTPRFNGCIKAGTKAAYSDRIESLDSMPFLFFVLWDYTPKDPLPRCRVWVVRTKHDEVFREMCVAWYKKRASGEIVSTNFQLHPPRGLDTNVFRNTCGNLEYPLLFSAEFRQGAFELTSYTPELLENGACVVSGGPTPAPPPPLDLDCDELLEIVSTDESLLEQPD
jgi:hypothetical protein